MKRSNTRTYAILSALCFVTSIVYYAFFKQLIIISFPRLTTNTAVHIHAHKKTIHRYYIHNDTWHDEPTDLIIPEQQAQALERIVLSWLNVLDEENISKKNVTLQSITLSATHHEAFISFNRHPFYKESSTLEKLQWTEGLLRTIKESALADSVQSVHFLVQHQPMHDLHLDFSNPWPIHGFLQSE